MVKRSIPVIRYSPEGKGQGLFARLRQDDRVRVRFVRPDQRPLSYADNVCAWVSYRGREFAVGGSDENGFLHELSKEIRKDFSSYRSEEANV